MRLHRNTKRRCATEYDPRMRTDNPALVNLHRGGQLESIHRGAWVLVNPSGAVIERAGEPSQLIYPRSATKSLQALPLVESGAADHFGFDHRHLALALASHSGEPCHTEVVNDGLLRIDRRGDDLLCGPQRPFHSTADAEANRITNNCSGKHVGFLAVAAHLGVDPASYLDPDGEVQQLVRAAVESMCGEERLHTGTDGCSAPTFSMSLTGLATALARMTNPDDLDDERARACSRLTDAARAHPILVAGSSDRFCTDLLEATGGRVFGKIGAEGVYTLGVIGEGVGFAGKVDDGNARGLYALMIDLLRRRDLITARELAALDLWASTVVRNWDGLEVGHLEICPR